jgi:hypothetical protein
MRFFEWMGGTIAIAGLAMSVQVANAQQCDLNVQTSCVVDTVVITGSGGSGGGGGGTGYPGFGTGGGGGQQTIPLPPLPPGGNTRTVPACLAEKLVQDEVGSFLMTGGNPLIAANNGFWNFTEIPGFRGTMGYPAGPYWTKIQRNFIVDDGNGVFSTISIHFEWNVSTNQFTYPPHYNNTPQQGCKS